MTSSRFWQYSALAVVFLGAMVFSFPTGNAMTLTEDTRIEEMRILVSWGDVDGNVGTVGTGSAMTWDGKISIDGGNMIVLRQLFFKDANDRLLNEEGMSIDYQSDITSDMDGLFLRVLPQDGRSETITVTLNDGTTVSQPLLSFVTNKELTFPVRDGMAIRLKAEAIILQQGDLRAQGAKKLAELLKQCTDSGKSEADCRKSTEQQRKTQNRLQRAKIWDALVRESGKLKDPLWAGKMVHPDVLFLLTDKQLEELTRANLSRMELKKLSHLTDMVYKTILRLAPDRIAELSAELQQEGLVLEGTLPESVRTIGNLDEEQFRRFKRFLASLDQSEREDFVAMVLKFSPTTWDTLKSLDDDSLRNLGRIMRAAPDTKSDAVLKAYLRQATKISNLKIKLEQLRSRLSMSDAQELEDMLARLSGTLLWTGDDTPMILTNIDGFLGRSGALKREEFAAAMKTLRQEVQQALAENNVGLLKDDLGLFSDVSASSWYAGFVGMMRADGLLSGYKDKQGKATGQFGPENPVTVGELLKIVLETSGNGTGSGTAMLPGAKGHWAAGYVVKAEELHLSIIADQKLDLNRPATRAEVVQTFIEAYGISPAEITKSSFSDVFPNMPSGRFIEFAKNHDAVSGDDRKNSFRPTDKINRAEVAKIGVRMKAILSELFDTSTVEGDLES